MVIRKAEERDIPEIVRLHGEMYETLARCGFPYALDDEALLEVIATLQRSRLCCLMVAEEEGRVVGFISAALTRLDRKLKNEDKSPVGIINDVYTVPEVRGRGTAAALCAAAEDWMRENGVLRCRAEIVSGNENAFAFWKKLGYTDMYTVVSKEL